MYLSASEVAVSTMGRYNKCSTLPLPLKEFPAKKDEKSCRMNHKWINEKDFVTDMVFRYTITAGQSLLWSP